MLPAELRCWVDIGITGTYKPEIVSCKDAPGDRLAIEIDLLRWQNLPRTHRDLLFFQQVAIIQQNSIQSEGWEKTALLMGLGGAVGELWMQDIWLLVLSLALASVAGIRLYRRNRSHQAIRAIYAADRKAIALAIQYGYPPEIAHQSLLAALQGQCNQAQNSELKTQYRARALALRHCR